MKLHTLFINHSILCRYQTCWYTSQGYLHFPQTHITQNSPHPDAAKGWLYIYLHIYICSCLFVLHCAAAAWKAWPPQHLHLGSKPHSSSQRNRNWLTQHLQTLPIRSCSVHTGCGASQAPKADLIEVKKNGGYYSCLLVLGFTFLFLLVCKQCFLSIKIMGWWVCGWLSHLWKTVKGKKVIGQVCVVRNWFIIFCGVSFIPLLDSYKERLTENVMKESRGMICSKPKEEKAQLEGTSVHSWMWIWNNRSHRSRRSLSYKKAFTRQSGKCEIQCLCSRIHVREGKSGYCSVCRFHIRLSFV